ncbi:chemotaxis protein CheB [Flavisolibacter ginsenosidimutans]|uniref:protein-glutamate methylesterase n=1 Tax=Flavisolibacter ginsenosidimutans TaxID=661481 RepID=A0A5B8UH04_9BACT|nr:chemotaxis protein CheB [Flavisolibacter ginsenosidimutans]QEC55645.1 chemotaxis protein CheB [Flavisolibacter ginsenosidimutans]
MAQDAVKYKMIVMGGSAGSLDAILKIVPVLPVRSSTSFLIVIHRKNEPDSLLTELLSARTIMPVKEVEDKEPILPNHLYVAPPDYHLLMENQHWFSLDSSEKIHYSRPSIDVTFESVAETFGPACVGILLSGANADGAEGLKKIKGRKGLTVVQDPATADVQYMPQAAIDLFAVDKVLAPGAIAGLIGTLIG